MIPQPVAFGDLRAVVYDAGRQVLEVEFHGGIYQYFSVPDSTYSGLMWAAST